MILRQSSYQIYKILLFNLLRHRQEKFENFCSLYSSTAWFILNKRISVLITDVHENDLLLLFIEGNKPRLNARVLYLTSLSPFHKMLRWDTS